MGKNDRVKELLIALSDEIRDDKSKKEFVMDYLLGKVKAEKKKLDIDEFFLVYTHDSSEKEIRVDVHKCDTSDYVCTLMSLSKEGICLYYHVGLFLDLNCDDEGRVHVISEEELHEKK